MDDECDSKACTCGEDEPVLPVFEPDVCGRMIEVEACEERE
jgi:hypothetical protein